jgi:hypothetical protein
MTPENLRSSMRDTWFESDFCRYIDNETYYDKNRNITKETWYYKSGEIVDDYIYTYDKLNRLIKETSNNKYLERRSQHFYDGNSKIPKFEEYYSKWEKDPTEKFVNNMESFKPLLLTRFDHISRTDSIFSVTNRYMKNLGNGSYTEANDSIYYQKLIFVRKYDSKFRLIEEKKFKPDDYVRKKVFLVKHMIYEYDEFGHLNKETDFKDGKFHYFTFSTNGNIIEETVHDDFEKPLITNYKYSNNGNLLQRSFFREDKLLFEKRFEYKGNYINKLFYLDKIGKGNEKIDPIIITFKYKFDNHKNWTEIIKNVNGTDLYKWIRKIEYY